MSTLIAMPYGCALADLHSKDVGNHQYNPLFLVYVALFSASLS
jgi:hypothetical protein